ncbi:aldo/keto reductase, partial [Mesorhizobium sp. M4B.F.Ca.ET.088.02.2.1]
NPPIRDEDRLWRIVDVLVDIGKARGVSGAQVALAWLLRRSTNILLIPGTSSVGHLRENLAAAELELSAEVLQELEGVAKAA